MKELRGASKDLFSELPLQILKQHIQLLSIPIFHALLLNSQHAYHLNKIHHCTPPFILIHSLIHLPPLITFQDKQSRKKRTYLRRSSINTNPCLPTPLTLTQHPRDLPDRLPLLPINNIHPERIILILPLDQERDAGLARRRVGRDTLWIQRPIGPLITGDGRDERTVVIELDAGLDPFRRLADGLTVWFSCG